MRFGLFSVGLASGLLAALAAIWLGAGPGLAALAYALAASTTVLGAAFSLAHIPELLPVPIRLVARRSVRPPLPPSTRR